MDVNLTFLNGFLNGFLNEEVYVERSPGFENVEFSNHVFELYKAQYGFKKVPRACYELPNSKRSINLIKSRMLVHQLH